MQPETNKTKNPNFERHIAFVRLAFSFPSSILPTREQKPLKPSPTNS